MNGKPNSDWLAGCLDLRLADLLSARVIADGFDDTCFPKNVLERVKKAAALSSEPLRFAVDEQLNFVRARNYINVFLRSRFVIPMTDDVNTRMLDIDPTIPHHLMRKVAILGQTHCLNLAATAKILSPAKVSVRIRKDDVHAARAHSCARSRPLTPIVVPAHHIFDRMRVLIAIVSARVLILIRRTGAILVIRRRELVPILS